MHTKQEPKTSQADQAACDKVRDQARSDSSQLSERLSLYLKFRGVRDISSQVLNGLDDLDLPDSLSELIDFILNSL